MTGGDREHAPTEPRRPGRYTVALAITVASFAFWTTWNYARTPCHVYADFSCGGYTDHFSHVGMARMFTAVGFEIYDRPRGELGRPLTSEEQAALPPDLRVTDGLLMGALRTMEGWPPDKPFFTSWSTVPSFYPPGDLVMYAPIAAAFSFMEVSFGRLNLATIQLLIGYAHISVFLMLLTSMGRSRIEGTELLALAIAYVLIMRWTIEGFYDGGWIAPLVIAPAFLVRSAGFQTVTAFALSSFAHFRGMFYLPWAARGVVDIVRGRQWKPWTLQKTAMAGGTLLMGGLTALTFLRVREALEAHQLTNPFNPAFDVFDPAGLITLMLVTLPGAIVFARRRSWLDVATLVWIVFMITRLPETRPWDSIALVPWMVAPALTPDRDDPLVRQLRAVTALAIMSVVFTSPVDATWLRQTVGHVLS